MASGTKPDACLKVSELPHCVRRDPGRCNPSLNCTQSRHRKGSGFRNGNRDAGPRMVTQPGTGPLAGQFRVSSVNIRFALQTANRARQRPRSVWSHLQPFPTSSVWSLALPAQRPLAQPPPARSASLAPPDSAELLCVSPKGVRQP